MKGLLRLIAMSVGGWLGWQLGAVISLFTGFIISVVGSALGLYGAQLALRKLLP